MVADVAFGFATDCSCGSYFRLDENTGNFRCLLGNDGNPVLSGKYHSTSWHPAPSTTPRDLRTLSGLVANIQLGGELKLELCHA